MRGLLFTVIVFAACNFFTKNIFAAGCSVNNPEAAVYGNAFKVNVSDLSTNSKDVVSCDVVLKDKVRGSSINCVSFITTSNNGQASCNVVASSALLGDSHFDVNVTCINLTTKNTIGTCSSSVPTVVIDATASSCPSDMPYFAKKLPASDGKLYMTQVNYFSIPLNGTETCCTQNPTIGTGSKCTLLKDIGTCKSRNGIEIQRDSLGQCVPTKTNSKIYLCLDGQDCETAIGTINTTPTGIVNVLMRIIVGIAGGIGLFMLMFAGYQILTSAGDPQKMQAAKEMITSVIVGIVMIVMSMVMLRAIGVDILGLPPLVNSNAGSSSTLGGGGTAADK